MARTKKVGITGRFGARYGRKAKRQVKKIEENMKKKHVCPKCDRPYVKRVSAGIWECKKWFISMLNCKIKDLFKSKIKNSYFSQIKISKNH